MTRRRSTPVATGANCRLGGTDEILVPVVGVGDVHVVTGEHVVADDDPLVRDDAAPPPDAGSESPIVTTSTSPSSCPGDDARRERDVRTDHGAAPIVMYRSP